MIPAHKGEIPTIVLLLPFAASIAFGYNLFPTIDIQLLNSLFAALCLVFVLLNINYVKILKIKWLGGLILHLVLFVFGWIIVNRHNELRTSDHFSKLPAKYLAVTINSQPQFKDGIYRFTTKVAACMDSAANKVPATGTLMVAIKDTAAKKFAYGDVLIVPAKYKPIDPPFNLAEFNYKSYMAGQNVWFETFLYPRQYCIAAHNGGNAVTAWSLDLRQRLVLKLKRHMRDTSAQAVASALLLGYKADLNEDTRQVYTKTGSIYILTVAGSQVAIIYLLLDLLLAYLRPYRYGKVLRAIIIIAVIWGYALLTGLSLPVCRAALMLSFVVTGKTFNRYISTLNILAIAAFILLIYNPFSLAEAGFQLSFIAVGGLILFQPVLYRLFRFKNKWADKIWALCSVSIAAQLVLLPLCALYFHDLPVYFLISNLLIAIPSTVIMCTGIIYLLLPEISAVSAFLGLVLEKTILLTTKGLSLIATLPVVSVSKIWITLPECLLLFGIILPLFFFLHYKKAWLLQLSLVCCLLFCISIGIKKVKQSDAKTIAWLNLKKHTGIVFKNGNEAVVLSDLADTAKNYKYSIQPYLDSCQVNKVSVYNPANNFELPWIKKKYGLIQCINTSVFIVNQPVNERFVSPKIDADYLYLTGNPHMPLSTVNNSFGYQHIVMDGTNSDQSIIKWQADAAKKVDFKILKRNKSFVSVSNKK